MLIQTNLCHLRVYCVLITCKVPDHWAVGLVFHFKNMSLECIIDPTFSLSNIFSTASYAFQAINEMHHYSMCLVVPKVLDSP